MPEGGTLTEIPAPDTPASSSEIRPFPLEDLQGSMDRILNQLPPDRTGAVIAYANLEAAGLAVMARLGDNWSYVASVDKPWHGALEAQTALRFSWALLLVLPWLR